MIFREVEFAGASCLPAERRLSIAVTVQRIKRSTSWRDALEQAFVPHHQAEVVHQQLGGEGAAV